MLERPRIIDVERKPRQFPKCKGRVVNIIYDIGDMTEIEFMLEYRKEGIMGGDNIPHRPPIWACAYGCKRFRKVNPDGTDTPVKLKMLKDIKKAALSKISWTSNLTERAISSEVIHHYKVEIVTEYGEKEILDITAVCGTYAEDEAMKIIASGGVGLKGRRCVSM